MKIQYKLELKHSTYMFFVEVNPEGKRSVAMFHYPVEKLDVAKEVNANTLEDFFDLLLKRVYSVGDIEAIVKAKSVLCA